MLAQPKKIVIIHILDILKKYTDFDHRLTQKEIQNILKSDYGTIVDRKAVKRNLMDLIDAGYNIDYDVVIRKNKNGDEEEMATNWYYEREISDAELRILIDSILFSKHIPQKQSRDLIKKIEGISSKYFDARVKNVSTVAEENVSVKQLFYTVEIIDEAITRGKQIRFTYNNFDTDKKLHARCRDDGSQRIYIINPIQIVAANGRYYLIANYDKYDNISHYRLDRITDIELLDTPSKQRSEIKSLEHGLNLPKHMAEHIYMFSGESVPIKFKADRHLVSEIIDWFGMDVTFSEVTDDIMTVSAICNEAAFRYWALQYSRFIRVTYPTELVKTIKNDLKEAYERYV